ncbi:hypothetical protein BGX28_009220 [Mortierella sp. GBA30]|nr:hypothetical protein BGX28_009220 [Mortierella sp. GBA30]
MAHKRGRGDQNHMEREHSPARSVHDDFQRSKKIKLECISSSSSPISDPCTATVPVPQPSTVTDVQSTPVGSTPATKPRLSVTANGFRVNSFNIHRLLITCLMVAAKFTSDLFYSNARYAKVGGLSLLELNQLELEFLFTTRFELNVKVEELQRVGNALLKYKNIRSARAQRQQQAMATNQPKQQTPQASQASQAVHKSHQSSHGHLINTTVTTDIANPSLQRKASRLWVPSPTSPKRGPMSDNSAVSIPSTSSTSSSSSTSITAATPTGGHEPNVGGTTVVVAIETGSQRAQLLSPPEEKQSWNGADIQENAERIDQTPSRTQTQLSSFAEATSESTSISESL